jgi:hypothetical protein
MLKPLPSLMVSGRKTIGEMNLDIGNHL